MAAEPPPEPAPPLVTVADILNGTATGEVTLEGQNDAAMDRLRRES